MTEQQILEPPRVEGTGLEERLTRFLAARGALGDGDAVRHLRRLIGGYSREMWFFEVGPSAPESYVLRMDPPELTSMLVTDRVREWGFLSALHAEGSVLVPRPCWLDADGTELGRPSIIMTRVPGRNTLEMWRDDSDEERVMDDWARRSEGLARLMASYTRVDLDTLPDFVERPSSWDAYMSGCEARWRDCEAAYPEPVPLMRFLSRWLATHRPEPVPLALVHGDMQPNNVLLDDQERFYAVDWEMAHVGDPREDLGWWLFTEFSNPAPYVSLFLDRFCATYRAETGMTESQLNPDVLRYFMIAGALGCHEDVMEQIGAFVEGRTTSTNVGYVAVALPFMHGNYMQTVRQLIQEVS